MRTVRHTTTLALLAIWASVSSCDSEGREATAASVQLVVPTQLAIARQPAGAASGAVLAVQPLVHVRDANNSTVAGSTAEVTAAVSGGTGTLSGTTVVTAVNGVAAFPNLSITGSGTHSLEFTSRGMSAATSGPFNVTGSATRLEMGTQPTDAFSGAPITATVQLRDADGSVVAGSSAAVTAAIESGAGTLNGTKTVNAVQGIATFSGLSVSGTGAHALMFASAGLTSTTSASFNVSEAPAAQLAVTTQPTTAASGQAFTPQPVVQVRNASNGVVTSSAASVTAEIASGGGTLSGTTVVNALNGVASFTDLAIGGGGAHTLRFTSGSLAPATASLMVSGGPATQLAVTARPSSATSTQPFAPQPVVQIRDASNGVVTSATDPVTVAITSGGGTLSGTTVVNAVNGVASFTNLAITGTGAHTLTFTSGSLASTSANFGVSGGPATQLVVVSQPSSAVSGQPFSPLFIAQVRDASNGVVTSSTVPVTIAIASGSGSLSGTTVVNAVNGVATFPGLAITGIGTHTLSVASGPLVSDTSNSFDVSALPLPPPPPPPGPVPDIASHDFENGTLGPYYTESGAAVMVVDDPSGLRGGKVLSVRYADPGPLADINKQIKFNPLNLGLGQTFFFRGYLYFPTGTAEFENPLVQRKLLYWQGGSNNEFHFVLDMRAARDGLYIVYSDGMRAGGNGGTTGDTYINSGPITMGAWYCIETEVRLNSTKTSQDGIIRVWVNGGLKYENTSVLFMPLNGYNNLTTWRSWYIGQQREGRDWVGGLPEYNINETRYWDNVAFSSTRIGQCQ